MRQMVKILGKKQSAIYKHMAMLRDQGALRWRPAGCGTLIVSFPDNLQDSTTSNDCGVDFINSKEFSEANFPSTKMENDSINVESSVFKLNQESKSIKEDNKNIRFHENGKDSTKMESNAKRTITPIAVYISFTKLTPNQTQRKLINTQVIDLNLWRSSLEHWLSHGWSPRNVVGMLNLYAQGGPESCSYCHPKKDSLEPPIEDFTEQRERDRIRVRKIIEQAKAKKIAEQNNTNNTQS
jgi:hypothetical protein